jgi:hypothetical protein
MSKSIIPSNYKDYEVTFIIRANTSSTRDVETSIIKAVTECPIVNELESIWVVRAPGHRAYKKKLDDNLIDELNRSIPNKKAKSATG